MDKRTLRKQDIIEKSFGVMYAYGYHGTSIQDLADAAGIPKGSLYNYFENKEDYVKEALLYYQASSVEQLQLLSDTSLEPLERIKRFYAQMIQSLDENKKFSKGCFIGKMAQELSGIHEDIRDLVETLHLSVVVPLENDLYEAVQNGTLKANTHPKLLAEFIHSSWHGTLLRLKSTQSKETLDHFYQVLTEVLLK